jgi:hypothetical protein
VFEYDAASLAHWRGRACSSSGFISTWCLPSTPGATPGSAFSKPRLPNHVHMATAINQEIGVSSYWAAGCWAGRRCCFEVYQPLSLVSAVFDYIQPFSCSESRGFCARVRRELRPRLQKSQVRRAPFRITSEYRLRHELRKDGQAGMQAQECAAKGQGERRCSINSPIRC